MKFPTLHSAVNTLLQEGTIIPAHPLALKQDRTLDEKKQRALTRYYIACGVGGVAVGVHTTQFEIRKPEVNLFHTVLELASEEIGKAKLDLPFIKVAGIVGPLKQAVQEAETASKFGYHLGLLSMGGLKDVSESELIYRATAVAEKIPLFGFYLQPAVGGRLLSYKFWRAFADIPNVQAIKVAAFNRYQTLDVVRAVCDSARRDEIALYTGNDDNIVADLLTPYRFVVGGKEIEKKFVGGLLGHWAVWTKTAVDLLKRIKRRENIQDLLAEGIKITDMNAVIFDANHSFHGCIPGIHEILRRQGLLDGIWCLNPEENLSPGQLQEIERICNSYPELLDDGFVKDFLQKDKS
jgi:dihydrodipicolinate synthase/N-acetylneuraminate lyase